MHKIIYIMGYHPATRNGQTHANPDTKRQILSDSISIKYLGQANSETERLVGRGVEGCDCSQVCDEVTVVIYNYHPNFGQNVGPSPQNKTSGRSWWHISLIPALGRQGLVDFCESEANLVYIHIEFQDNQGYIKSQKKEKKKKKKNQTITIKSIKK